jgi:ankyrin repeat protein
MVDVNIVDKFGSTPLHLACQNGQYESVVTLLSYGANPSAGDTSGNCPLHYAAAYGWLNIVQLLMETTECDPNPSNLWKTTPCGIADRKGHTKVVRYFLGNKTKKIDVNFKDNEGKTLLHHCVGESYTSQYEAEKAIAKAKHLIASGADPNARDVEGKYHIFGL